MATQPVSGKSQDPNISLIPKPCLFNHFLEKCFSRYIGVSQETPMLETSWMHVKNSEMATTLHLLCRISGGESRNQIFSKHPRWFWYTFNVGKTTVLEHVIYEVSIEKINIILHFLRQLGSNFLSLLYGLLCVSPSLA